MTLETVPAGEEQDIKTILASLKQTAENGEPTGSMGHLVHRKAHGLLEATLTIDGGPEHLRFGLFERPGTYQCLIRFSNGSGKVQKDSAPDVRGVAIKVKLNDRDWSDVLYENETGNTQDILMSNGKVFFVRDVADYVEFTRQNANGTPLKFFFGGYNPFRWRFHEAMCLAGSIFEAVSNLLTIRYGSQTAFQIGPYAGKFLLVPSGQPAPQFKRNTSPNFLRETMANHLMIQPASFDLLIQVQSLPDKMPVEDPTVEWDEKLSPFYKVGTLHLPVQQFDNARCDKLAESLSFTPGHTVHHRPLGGINRVRMAVYSALSALRRRRNGVLK
jgi:hypothetical protein